MPVSKPRSRAPLVVLLLLLSLEASLQVLAYAAFSAARRADDAPSDARHVVLCAGDSFTYGMGAVVQGGSYPARLARRLADDDVAVHNAGWPGQNSRDVLLGLPSLLARHRPELVYVLVGLNDGWSLPAPVSDADLARGAAPPSESFPWRWRTGRLLALALGGDDDGDGPVVDREPSAPGRATPADVASRDPSALEGPWHLAGQRVVFGRDGTLSLGRERRAWRVSAARLEIQRGDGTWDLVDWDLDGDRLTLVPVDGSAPLLLERGEPETVAGAWHAALDALRLGHWPAAEERLRTCIASDIERVEATVLLARTLVALGRAAEVRDGLLPEWRASHRTGADPTAAETELRIALELGDGSLAVPLACELLATDARSQVAVEAARRFGFEPERRPALLAALESAARTLPVGDGGRVLLLRQAAQLCRKSDAPRSVHLAVAAWLEDGDERATSLLLTRGPERLDERVDEALDALDATPDERAALDAVLGRAGSGDSGWAAVLSRHLEQIVEVCRDAGCEVVLLSYPDASLPVDAVIAEAAGRSGAPCLDPSAAFARRRREHPGRPLFVPNGHPSDAGYEVLAEVVAADAQVRFGRARSDG